MTLLDVVKQYVSEGHKVNYRVRSDGGIIITSVDGMKFTRTGEGNRYLRQVTGANLSATRMQQTSYNVQKFIKLKEGQHKASSKGDTMDLKKLTKKAQREWRKNKTVGEGKVTIRKVRWYQEHKGEEYTKDYLNRRMRYSQGWAYEENVYYWASVIEQQMKMQEEAQAMRRNATNIHQQLLENIHDVYYDWIEKKIPLEEAQRKIRNYISEELN